MWDERSAEARCDCWRLDEAGRAVWKERVQYVVGGSSFIEKSEGSVTSSGVQGLEHSAITFSTRAESADKSMAPSLHFLKLFTECRWKATKSWSSILE